MKTLRLAIVLLMGGFATSATSQEPGVVNVVVANRTIAGVLECRTLADNAYCGRDEFTITHHVDGTRALRALAVSDIRGLQIDIVLRVDRAFRPLEAFTQSYSDGKFLGVGFFAVSDDTLSALTKTPQRIVSETIPVPDRFSMLLHPVSADGWHFGHYDKAAGGRQSVPRCAVGGARESVRCALSESELAYVGPERLTVPAGTFETEHYRFGQNTEVWLAGPDYMMVQHEFKRFGTRYRLTAYTETRTPD
ncbi:MAG: hypothetical protein SFV21_14755 [Rhodospirillaceae bacterium]|nr:hypothetical protein [Rhodospirillaceae bacterium]